MKGKKTGGRKAGTPNKVSAPIRAAISGRLEAYVSSGDFEKDFALLDGKERLDVFVKLTGYVVPKPLSVDIDGRVDTSSSELDAMLLALSQG